MSRNSIAEYSSNPDDNTDIGGTFTGEGWDAPDVNNAFRTLMAHLKDYQSGNGTGTAVAISNFYLPAHGNNWQIATQLAVTYALTNSIPRVIPGPDMPVTVDFWTPLRTSSFSSNAADGHPIAVENAEFLELDFCGITITMKGPTGLANKATGQPETSPGSGYYWLGGFIWGKNLGTLILRNVIVDGGYTGDVYTNLGSNVYDKGLWIQDTTCDKLITDNIELKNFAGEIMYDNSSAEHISRDCHYHGSPQSCWNPNGNGRVVAYNVQAGMSRQVAEVTGGAGHLYVGGRFYDGGAGGCTFVGGPDGAFGSPYNVAVRRTDKAPPYIQFEGTRFENLANAIYLGCWVRGQILCTDAAIVISNAFAVSGHIQDVDLDIITTADRCGNNYDPVTVEGPGSFAGSQLTNINLRVRAGRTDYSQSTGNSTFAQALKLVGAIDPDTCTFAVAGTAKKAWSASPTTAQRMPRVDDRGFVASSPEVFSFSANFTWTVASPLVLLLSNAASAGTYDVSMDTTHSFSDGQRIKFVYAQPGTPTKIVRFLASGGGMKLPANRELKDYGDFIELEYNATLGAWIEANWVGT